MSKQNVHANNLSALNSDVKGFVSQHWSMAFVLISLILLVQGVYYLNQQSKGSFVNTNISVFIDEYASYQFDEVAKLPNSYWRPADSFYFQSQSGKVWLKFKLPEEAWEQDVYLRLHEPLLDKFEFYRYHEKTKIGEVNKQIVLIEQLTGGDTTPFNERALKLPNFVIPILPVSGSSDTQSDLLAANHILLNAQSKLDINLGFSLWSSADFIEYNDHYTIFFGMLFGYLLALISYSLMMFAKINKQEYLWYGLFLLGFLSHIMSLSGYAFFAIWPSSVGIQSVAGGATVSITFFFLIKFTQSILQVQHALSAQIFKVLGLLNLAIFVLTLLTLNTFLVKLSVCLVLITALILSFTCLREAKTGELTAKFSTLIWFIFLISALLSSMIRFQLLAISLDPILVLVIGFHVETLIIGGALIYQYRTRYWKTVTLKESALQDKEKAVSAKDEILQLQKDAKSKLERQVEAQTTQLVSALSKLSEASQELETIRNLDGLTGLPNRLAFEDSLDQMALKSIELAIPLSIAVIDIDHFKKVNDTFGHLAGDDCLLAFAKMFKQQFAGKDYSYCRFGGEEFILASLKDARLIEEELNQFKDNLENSTITTQAGDISLTTSAGITSRRLSSVVEARQLFSRADEKLYLAKQQGRNLVVA